MQEDRRRDDDTHTAATTPATTAVRSAPLRYDSRNSLQCPTSSAKSGLGLSNTESAWILVQPPFVPQHHAAMMLLVFP